MIVILSYCDTPVKKKQLSDLINEIKFQHPQEEILVYSHYANLEPEYYKGCNYYIFDYTNPISEKSFADWVHVSHQSKIFYRWGLDYGFAVLQMIKRTCIYLSNIGHNKVSIINYDLSVDEVKKIQFPELSDEQVGAFANWGNNPHAINLTYMFLDLSKFDVNIFKSITYEKYKSYSSDLLPEAIFYHIISEFFQTNWKSIGGLKLCLSSASRMLPENHYLTKYFHTILPTRWNLPENKRKCIGMWDCINKIHNVEVSINGINFILKNEVEGENSNSSFFSHLPTDNCQEITLISINDEKIQPYVISDLDENYWKRNYHISA